MKKYKKGFSLIELLVVIAIIGILALVAVVSFSGIGKQARASKALSQLAGAVPAMMGCWGNGGDVMQPNLSPFEICSLGSSFGYWPRGATGDLATYNYTSSAASGIISKTSWWISLASVTDGRKICCNSYIKNCKLLDSATAQCTSTIPNN